MTDKQFNAVYSDAITCKDKDAFVSDWALSSMFDDGEEAVSKGLIRELGRIWDVAHLSFNDIVAASGASLTDFAARYAIPYRTVQHWAAGDRECPAYVLLLLAMTEGFYP